MGDWSVGERKGVDVMSGERAWVNEGGGGGPASPSGPST